MQQSLLETGSTVANTSDHTEILQTSRSNEMRIAKRRGLALSKQLLLCAFLITSAVSAQPGKNKTGGGGGKKTENIPVKITFENREGDRLLSVGGETYTDGQDGVVAVIEGGTGYVRLDTCDRQRPKDPCLSTGRVQLFDYTSHVAGPNLNETHVAGGSWVIHPRDAALARLPGGFRDITNFPGETMLSGMKVNYMVEYPDGYQDYTTRFAPLMFPDTNFVLITFQGGVLDCTSANGESCASWTVEAVEGAFDAQPPDCCAETQLEDIAKLVSWDNSLDFGNYHMPFKLTVTVLPK
jgi:hypothetical protein